MTALESLGSDARSDDLVVRACRKVRVLFINDTARNGGPGRSLYYILKFLDPEVVHRSVVLPREGVIADLLRGNDGSEKVVDDISFEPGLVENPVEPWSRAIERDDFDAPAPLRGARFVGNLFRAGEGIRRLTKLARSQKYDLLYCNGTNADFAGGALAKTSGVPALWHVRYTSLPPLVRPVHDRLAASRGVKKIICVSNAAAALFPHCMDKVSVIHNALDVNEFSPSAGVIPQLRAELSLPKDAVVFGSQGRILPRKGYVEMIRAAEITLKELAPQDRARCFFVILGDTPEDYEPDHLGECRTLVSKLGLDANVKFIGFRADVKPYVVDFDIAVVPSVYADPLPRAVIEGMACGKPVIAFDVGGVAEMLDPSCGQLIRGTPPDVAGMGAAFLRYFRDPELRISQGKNARARIVVDFDASRQAKKIQNEIVRAAGLVGERSTP
ncbi:MAG: glycosyltransferase family 4 protein [Polyangiaceae bacterium]